MDRSTLQSKLATILRTCLSPVVKRLFSGKLHRDPWFEYAMCLVFRPARLSLPKVELESLFPGAESVVVQIEKIPRGSWSSPVVDLAVLCKLLLLTDSRRIFELGSFKGYTAFAIAQHLPEDGRLVTFDCDPDHGEVYKGHPISEKIDRRVGYISADAFGEEDKKSFDLIFIDADHRYEAVKHDTDVLLPMLADNGWLVWHDYANWGYFNGACGVPEYLEEFARQRPAVHISGTNMAVFSPAWMREQGRE